MSRELHLFTTNEIESFDARGGKLRLVLWPRSHEGKRSWIVVGYLDGADYIQIKTHEVSYRIFKNADTAIALFEKHLPGYGQVVFPLEPDPDFDYDTAEAYQRRQIARS